MYNYIETIYDDNRFGRSVTSLHSIAQIQTPQSLNSALSLECATLICSRFLLQQASPHPSFFFSKPISSRVALCAENISERFILLKVLYYYQRHRCRLGRSSWATCPQ